MNRILVCVLGVLIGVGGTVGYLRLRSSRAAHPLNHQAVIARCFLEHNPNGYDPTSQFGQGILAVCAAANP